jgi:glycosyltransferase involved in cell wall biosynthesis
MRLVFIASRSLETIGGIETFMRCLLPIIVDKGNEVTLYCQGDKFSMVKKGRLTIIYLSAPKNKLLGKIILGFKSTIHSIIYIKSVDIYHYNAMAAGLSSVLPLILKRKVIFQGHGFEWKRAKWTNIERRIIKFLDDFVIRINKNITTVSNEQSQYVIKNFNKQAVTITPGVFLPDCTTINSKILETFKLKPNEYFLFLGRLVPEKNADKLIESFIASKINNKKLVVAGSALNERKFETHLKTLAAGNDKILFTGAVYGQDKEELIKNCFAFCIPSSLEGLPIVLLEAMAYSKICIASNIDGCKMALGDTGIIFDLNNENELTRELKEVSINYHNYENLGKLAFERIKGSFTWDLIADKYFDYAKQILKG